MRLRVGSTEVLVVSYPVPAAALPTLTRAERSVLDGLLRGVSLARIARGRRRSAATVKNQAASIYRKLGVHSRSELVARFAAPSAAL